MSLQKQLQKHYSLMQQPGHDFLSRKLKNTGDKFAQMGLTTNASPQSTKFNDLSETEPEYCWYLVKAEDPEAEK